MIELCTTALLARMDSDDIMHPERLRKQADFMTQHPEIAGVGCYFDKIDDSGKKIEDAFQLPVAPPEIREALRRYVCLQHGCATFRVGALREIGGFRSVLAEDLDVTLRLLAAGFSLANIPEVLLCYRIHSKSITFAAEEATLDAADEAYRTYGPQIWGDRAPDYVGGRSRLQRLRRRIKRNLKSLFA
jgi:GT2 family glycosyltransferase